MTEEKLQFDRLIGGPIDLPATVEFMNFSKHRTKEILALTQAIDDPQRTGLTFQQLPRHMRRRVMGHSSKRVPRIVREAHQRQLEKSGLPPPSKRPSRCHRRRPTNLLTEYNRRQKEFVWLETHIWHAKRFHMINKWGYKTPNFPNDKSFRACYRATSKHCLLQDVSYYSCIELTGSLKQLLDGLKHHTSQECGLTFGARYFLDGMKEGNVTLFRSGMFPFGAIGNVSFLWKPLEKETVAEDSVSQSTKRTLWVWIHPAFYEEVRTELVGTLKMESDLTTDMSVSELDIDSEVKMAEPKKKKPRLDKKVEETKLLPRNVPFKKTPKYLNKDGVELVLLKDTLNRFRLTGPLSQAVLSQALQIASTQKASKIKAKKPLKTVIRTEPPAAPKAPSGNIDEIFARMYEPAEQKSSIELVESSSDEEVMYFNGKAKAVEVRKPNDWWTDYYSSGGYRKASLDVQQGFWESLSGVLSPAQLPPHIVIGLNVKDPRLHMPAKRRKALPDDSKPWQQPLQVTPELLHPSVSFSAIWDPSVRDVAAQTKLSVAELNRERSKYLVPGDITGTDTCQGPGMPEAEDHSRIPVLVVQRPGSQQADVKRIGFGCGWDVVLPAGWGMPLWMSLVFRGARAGGLREAAALERERSDVSVLSPDTAAGRREADALRGELVDKHFRLPPDKRPNFLKLGISSPFSCAWDVLAREWSPDSTASPPACAASTPAPFFVLRDTTTLSLLRAAVRGEKTQPTISERTSELRNCFVPVALTMLRKGTPVDFSIVCIPSGEDSERFAKDPNWGGPVEEPHDDVNCAERKVRRAEHKALLKRLRKRRVRKKRKEQEGGKEATVAKEDMEEGMVVEEIESVTTTEKVKGTEVVKKRKPYEPIEKDVVDSYARESRALWLPETTSVKSYASRLTMGYVTQGDFVFTEAGGAAVGYVALAALLGLVNEREDRRKPVYVLVRNPTSYQYRLAKLNVLCVD